jgi:hypothetical protein
VLTDAGVRTPARMAAQGYLVAQGARAVKCAKLNHDTRERCIFRCRYGEETR